MDENSLSHSNGTENIILYLHLNLEGKRFRKIRKERQEKYSNLKYKYGNRHFWCRGYYVSTVGRNKQAIERYIKNQLHEDMISDQISLKEYTDPFKGSKQRILCGWRIL